MNTIHSDQREIRSRTWGPSSRGVRCYVSLPAHGERGVEYRSPDCFDAVLTSLNWPGRFANRRSGLLSIHVTLRPSPVERLRQRAGANPLGYRLSADLSRRFISSRLQLTRHGNQLGRYRSDLPEATHVKRLSCASVAYERNQTTKALAYGSILLPREKND